MKPLGLLVSFVHISTLYQKRISENLRIKIKPVTAYSLVCLLSLPNLCYPLQPLTGSVFTACGDSDYFWDSVVCFFGTVWLDVLK